MATATNGLLCCFMLLNIMLFANLLETVKAEFCHIFTNISKGHTQG